MKNLIELETLAECVSLSDILRDELARLKERRNPPPGMTLGDVWDRIRTCERLIPLVAPTRVEDAIAEPLSPAEVG
jgi:hypothetical protein